jgi:hypothetical protein
LTWFQVLVYWCDEKELGGVQRMGSGEAIPFRQMRQLERGVSSG